MDAEHYMQLEQIFWVWVGGLVLLNVLVAGLWLKTVLKTEYIKKLQEANGYTTKEM